MKFKIKKIRTKLRQKVLFGCLILIFLSLPLSLVWKMSFDNEIEVFNILTPLEPVKTSATLISPIYIDDTNPFNNWETFASTHIGDSWFTNATGTEGDPYIINNVLITMTHTCIYIINSKAHFMIVNSEISYSQYNGQGIYWLNVSNGHIINNNFTSNNMGMILVDSNNSVIAGNTFSLSEWGCIFFSNSHNNNIFNNTIDSNRYTGIALGESTNNTFYDNVIKNQGHLDEYRNVVDGAGIRVGYRSFHNNISGNVFTDNLYCGIELSVDSGNTTVTENTFNNNGLCGITLEDTTNNIIRDNLMTNNGILFDGIWTNMESNEISSTNSINSKIIYFYDNRSDLSSAFFILAGQIILINCSNLVIPSLSLSPGSVGITLIHCINITLLNSVASNNKLYGIHLIDCVSITISESITNSNGDCGILFEGCNNSKILDSEASYNDELISSWLYANDFSFEIGCGISLKSGINNLIANNNIQSNNISGVSLESFSNHNNISNNNFNDNNLRMEDCWDNSISENTFTNRRSQILLLRNTMRTQISENSFNGVHDAIELRDNGGTVITKNNFNGVNDAIMLYDSDANTITENIIIGDGGYGIVFRSSSNNDIERNEIYGVFQCFSEDPSSVSNVFTDNKCHLEDVSFSMILYTIILLVILGAGITGVIIGRRKGRKNRE